MASAGLPHVYPFRFVDTVLDEAGPDFAAGSPRTHRIVWRRA